MLVSFRSLSKRRQAATTAALLLLLAVSVLIFLFSAQPAVDSSATSHGFIEKVLRFLSPRFRTMADAEREALIADIHGVVRKFGHFSEYCALGFCGILFGFCRRVPRTPLFAFGFGVFYACTDELHQIFVPGRAGMVTDVLIDASGVLAGGLVCLLFLLILRRLFFRGRDLPSYLSV